MNERLGARRSVSPERGDAVERGMFPALIVRNEVQWTNDAFSSLLQTLPIKKHEATPFASVLRLADDDTPPDVWLKGRQKHYRSADIAAAYFKDAQGRIYRDIDSKGVGFTWKENVIPWETRPNEDDSVGGLMDERWALHDADIAEELTNLGIRTHRVLCVTRLHELPVRNADGSVTLVPIENIPRGKPSKTEGSKHNMLPHGFTPAVQVRAFGTKMRIDDVVRKPKEVILNIRDAEKEEHKRHAIQDAIQLAQREFPAVKDVQSYAQWFAETLGRNVALMHRAGYAHKYLTEHNITLDCRLLDFDSVVKIDLSTEEGRSKDAELLEKDMKHAASSMFRFQEELFMLFKEELLSRYGSSPAWAFDMHAIYQRAYNKEFPPSERPRIENLSQEKEADNPPATGLSRIWQAMRRRR